MHTVPDDGSIAAVLPQIPAPASCGGGPEFGGSVKKVQRIAPVVAFRAENEPRLILVPAYSGGQSDGHESRIRITGVVPAALRVASIEPES